MDNNPEIKKLVISPPDFQSLGGLEVCKTRHPASLELFYNLINDQAQITFPNHLRPMAYALADENIKYLLCTVSPGAGKLCANSTPILTYNRGWTTHGELKVGDFVFSPSGHPIKVLATIPQNEPASIDVEFIDGSIIKVHPNHEWTVYDSCHSSWRTVETKRLITKKGNWIKQSKTIKLIFGTPNKRGGHCRFHVPTYSPLQYPKRDLPVAPYVLGAWLGDGSSKAGRLTHDYRDLEVRDHITMYYKLGSVTKHNTTGVLTSHFYGLIQELRKLNLFKNKHIPRIYLESSIEQRLELLAGLIDTDGTVNERGQATFSNTNIKIIEGVAELIKSFGWRANIQTTPPKLSTSGIQGTLPVFRIKFTPELPIPTKIPRKKLDNPHHVKRRLGIKSIQKSNQPEPGMCIQVDSNDGLYLVGKNLIPTHNSLLTSVAYPIWELGLDYEKTVLGVSSAEDQMSKFLQASMGIVEYNKVYRNLYPNSVPDKGSGWCFLPDTQVLTRRGWLHFYELNETDEIATRNPENHKFEWQKPLEITCQDYSGEIINFCSRCIDLAVTPNHRMIVTDRKLQNSEKMIFADELAKRKHSSVPITSTWNGTKIKNVKIHSDRVNKKVPDSLGRFGMQPGKECKQYCFSGDDYCAFMGMYLAEGHNGTNRVGITQLKKSKGFKPYHEIMEKLFGTSYSYDEKKGTFYISSKSLADHVKQFGHLAPNKFVPDLIKNSTPHQIQIFLKYYRLGDGHTVTNGGPNGKTRSSRFYTTSYQMAGDLQELCQKAGWSSSVRKRIKTKDAIFPSKTTKAEKLRPIYVVREHFKKEGISPKNYLWVNKHKKFDYVGKVYCATVPNGTLYVRRNGFAVWTGNSPFRGMFLKRRVKGNPDPSYSISGLNSQSITGKHGQIIVGDDIEDKKYSESEHMLNQLEETFYKTLLGRRDPRGARVILVGRRWDINDLYHRLEITGDWVVMTLPSIRENAASTAPNLYYDVTVPANLSCVFNNFTPSPTVENIQVYYGYEPSGFYWQEQPSKADEARMARKSAPAVYQTVYQSKPELSEVAIFKDDDFAFYTPPEDLSLGASSDLVKRLINRAAMVVQSWDTAFTAEARNDASVCVTAALISCNQNHRILPGESPTTDLHYDVYVLDLFIERLEFADLTPYAEELFEKWSPDKILVEKGALGIPLVQHLTKIAAPVEGIAVQNVSKRQRALNGAKAGSAQGWMRSWRVKFPKDAIWFPDTKREFLKFTGAKGQKDDRVDALVQIINFTIDYGISAQEMPEGWRTDEEIDAQIRSWTTPKSSIDGFIDSIKTYYNPMIGLCQTCKHFSRNYCKYHKISVSAFHSCTNYDCKEEVSEWQTINLK